MTKKKCFKCNKVIDLQVDKYVCLTTSQGTELMEEGFWHFDCWVQWFNDKVTERFNAIGRKASKMMGMSFNTMQNLLEKFEEGGEKKHGV